MIGFGQPVFDRMAAAGPVEGMAAQHRREAFSILRQIGELDAVIGQHGVDPVGHGICQSVQKSYRGFGIGLLLEPGEGELRGSINRHEHVEFAVLGAQLSNVDVEEANRVAFEPLFRFRLTLEVRQPRDAVAQQKPVQAGARQLRNASLQGIKAIIQRQQRVLAKGNARRFLLGRQNRRPWRLRTHRLVFDRCPMTPFADSLRIQPIPLGELRDRSLRSLYCRSHRVRRRGASVPYLAHSPSLM